MHSAQDAVAYNRALSFFPYCHSFLTAYKNVLSTLIFHLRSFTFSRFKMLEYKSQVSHMSPLILDSSVYIVLVELLTFPPSSATSLIYLCSYGAEHDPRRNKSQGSHSR